MQQSSTLLKIPSGFDVEVLHTLASWFTPFQLTQRSSSGTDVNATNLEIEGSLTFGSEQRGLSLSEECDYEKIVIQLAMSNVWDETNHTTWEEIQDTTFSIAVPGYDQEQVVRTRTKLGTNLRPRCIEHTQKTTIGKIDVDISGNSQTITARIKCSREQDVSSWIQKETIVVPSYVCIQQRTWFRTGCWRYDVSRRWVGKTLAEAQVHRDQFNQTQRNLQFGPTYRIEIEFLPDYFQYDEHKHGPREHVEQWLALSLLFHLAHLSKTITGTDVDTAVVRGKHSASFL